MGYEAGAVHLTAITHNLGLAVNLKLVADLG
jgi:hypothetical protein